MKNNKRRSTKIKSSRFAARLRGISQLGHVFYGLAIIRTCAYLFSSN